MMVGYNYCSKERVLIRIAEEANLYNLEVATSRSCDKRIYFEGRAGAVFKIKARQCQARNWVVKEYERSVIPIILPYNNNEDSVFKEGDSDREENGREENNKKEDKSGEDDDDVIGEEGNVDDEPHNINNTNRNHRRTPIKARWLVPLIKSRLRERPNISNQECSHILRLHVRPDFFDQGCPPTCEDGGAV